MSLLEAAACGGPIVALDVPGCREIARPGLNALLVPADDASALAEAIVIESRNLRFDWLFVALCTLGYAVVASILPSQVALLEPDSSSYLNFEPTGQRSIRRSFTCSRRSVLVWCRSPGFSSRCSARPCLIY